jgi:anaerobic selenocysteine-containing dehydrogenase
MSNITACPLDCFDTCSIVYEEGVLKGDKNHVTTQGYLCPHLNHYDRFERIAQPRYKGEAVSMDEALRVLERKLRNTVPRKVLHYRSGGNMGIMQKATDHFFVNYGAALTQGSLCDGAGAAGIEKGRGANYALSPEQIGKSEVVIVWGRNPHATSSHILPYLKGKTLIVIDPYRTALAEQADLHIQLKPNGDLYLALELSRSLENEATDANLLEQIDVTPGDVESVLELVQAKRTVILTGIGVQKYSNGAATMQAIDGFAAKLNLFGKEGCGVTYLGSSLEGVAIPFETKAGHYEMKADAAFEKYDLVFVQGANPVAQMPDTGRVLESFGKAGEVVYFGLYENETSELADLVIPAKTFLGKSDVRSSYGSDTIQHAPILRAEATGISEYELAQRLCSGFGIELKSETACIETIMASAEPAGEGYFTVKGRMQPPYQNGFETSDGNFVFLDEVDYYFNLNEGLFLLTSKSPKSLNSQFKREEAVYIHPELGFSAGETVRISSAVGSVELRVKYDERLRRDCVLIYSGTPGVNYITSSRLSDEGGNAVYQQEKIKVELC